MVLLGCYNLALSTKVAPFPSPPLHLPVVMQLHRCWVSIYIIAAIFWRYMIDTFQPIKYEKRKKPNY